VADFGVIRKLFGSDHQLLNLIRNRWSRQFTDQVIDAAWKHGLSSIQIDNILTRALNIFPSAEKRKALLGEDFTEVLLSFVPTVGPR
jgi:hypothetical protein